MTWTLLKEGTFNGLSDATIDAVMGKPRARFYLSGDGHRNPPFMWATRPIVKDHFMELLVEEKLCFHVEQLPKDVTTESIPEIFCPAFGQRRVYGWELSMFRDLLPVMELIMEIMAGFPQQPINDVVVLHREMLRINGLAWKVGNPPWIRAALGQSDIFLDYWKGRRNGSVVANKSTEQDYLIFITWYNNQAMGLRTDANNHIADNIARNPGSRITAGSDSVVW